MKFALKYTTHIFLQSQYDYALWLSASLAISMSKILGENFTETEKHSNYYIGLISANYQNK